MSAVDFKLNSDNTHSDVYSVKILQKEQLLHIQRLG